MNMAQIEIAEIYLLQAHDKLGLEYLPDQVSSALKVMYKCLCLWDVHEFKDLDSFKNRFLRWKTETFGSEDTDLFSEFEASKAEPSKLAEDILNNLMRFYEVTPRIYYVWLLRDWGIFEDSIVEQARLWWANDCYYRDDIPAIWYEKY